MCVRKAHPAAWEGDPLFEVGMSPDFGELATTQRGRILALLVVIPSLISNLTSFAFYLSLHHFSLFAIIEKFCKLHIQSNILSLVVFCPLCTNLFFRQSRFKSILSLSLHRPPPHWNALVSGNA
jgi:hypothetical protein